MAQFSADTLLYFRYFFSDLEDFVIEVLRSISELVIYGDQNDPSFFDLFMEKQVLEEFLRILKISRPVEVSVQLMQTMSIMVQNLKSEVAIYYMFSNGHVNFLITYAFDFTNEELLSYYISFLRAISGKLDKNTISLLVKTTQNEDVVSFPLYVEAIRFAFHEESMIRIAVRTLTLNVYHVGDDSVNKYISCSSHSDYFSNLVRFFCNQCNTLNNLIVDTPKKASAEFASTIMACVDEIEDNLYYLSDVISAGIPHIVNLITDIILGHLILPLLLPSLCEASISVGSYHNAVQIEAITSLYLLCCILRIVKIKDLANTIAAALLCPLEAFARVPDGTTTRVRLFPENNEIGEAYSSARVGEAHSCSTLEVCGEDASLPHDEVSCLALREGLLSYVTKGDDIQVLGSLSMLATLLQTKELGQSVLDALGILPQRKQHKQLVQQALLDEASGKENSFSSDSDSVNNETYSEIDIHLQRLKDQYCVSFSIPGNRFSFTAHRFQVLDALVSLVCRSNISSETLWDGGWLLRQLLPHSEAEFDTRHLELLKTSYKTCIAALQEEIRGSWSDHLISVLCVEWKKCKRAMESSSPKKEPKSLLLPALERSFEAFPPKSSFASAEKMVDSVKVFVLLHQLQIFSLGKTFSEQPPINPLSDSIGSPQATIGGLACPKLGSELRLDDAVPCKIAFLKSTERHLYFMPICVRTSGWVILAEELPSQTKCGVVRFATSLVGSTPRIDEKNPAWLHLRIRPSNLPIVVPHKFGAFGKSKEKALFDGRWTLAFRDEISCKLAFSLITEEIKLQRNEVARILEPLFNQEMHVHSSNTSQKVTSPSNSFTR